MCVRAVALLCVGVALLLVGCGSSASTTTAVGGSGSSKSSQGGPSGGSSGKPGGRAFLQEVDVVCQTVRQGAPQVLRPPFRRAAVARYAGAATGAAMRTAVSLQRLATQADGRGLRLIASGYVTLGAAYSTARLAARDERSAARLGQTIQLHEQAVTAASRSAGVPACGVAGR